MSTKLSYLTALTLLLGMVTNASAELVGYWRLDEGSGTTVYDSSASGNDGTFEGDPQWVAGQFGNALEFDGDDWVNFGAPPELVISGEISITCWANPTGFDGRQGFAGLDAGYAFKVHEGGRLCFTTPGILDHESSSTILEAGTWQHVAVTFTPGQAQGVVFFLNGVETDQLTASAINAGSGPFRIGSNQWNEALTGMLDEVRVYNHILTEPEILASMEGGEGYPYAFGPDPEDGALHEDTWVTLSWKAGDFAVSHDVYLGDNYDDVDNGTGDTFRGNQAGTFLVAGFPGFPYPDGLVPGTTYYWRVDEVNDADPNSPWKGDVWSFSVPPKTAYNPSPADGAESVGPENVTLTWTPGFGAKLHTVYFGESYDEVNDAVGGAPMGITTYNPGPLEAEKVYYWRVDEFDAVATYKGDVWSFSTPGTVGGPQPAYKATDIAMNVKLNWTDADSAFTNHLYFGTDKEAVRNADTGAPEYKGSIFRPDEIYDYDPGLLEADTAYYWRVDTVDTQDNVSKGPLWVFTTGAFLLVDDFEIYTDDDAANRAIWQTWIDGFGVADNGAQVGYLIPPYAEQTIVHGGLQSMPLLYINETGVTNSEASMTLTALRDWTQVGVAELSLWVRGASGNAAEPLYAAISNSAGAPAVVANDDPSAAAVRAWTQWRIPLQAFADQGINLSNVDQIAIGLGTKAGMAAPGGSGTLYVDDIRLDRLISD